MKLEADVRIEVDVTLSGTFVRGYPASGPTYSSGGEPGAPDDVEDVEAGAITVDMTHWTEELGSTTLNLLHGLDDAAKAIVRANFIRAIGEEVAVAALLNQVPDDSSYD